MFRARGLPIVYTRSALDDIAWTGKATKAKRANTPAARAFQRLPRGDRAARRRMGAGEDQGQRVLRHTAGDLSGEGADRHARWCAACRRRAACAPAWSTRSRTACRRSLSTSAASTALPFAHAANLFDMNGKYASVVSLAEIEALLP